MIAANEFRIGNLINNYYKGIEVVSVGTLNMLEQYNPNEHQQIFKPIPLTEEILLKCGFKVSNTYWIELNGGTHHIDLHCINKVYYPILVQEPEMSSEEAQVINLHKIQYLHQLQNLYFALTGEELTVNL